MHNAEAGQDLSASHDAVMQIIARDLKDLKDEGCVRYTSYMILNKSIST